MKGSSDIWCARGGGEGVVLVLLHGLGANATVWDGLLPIIEASWQGAWLAPDLRGHGRSAHKPPYGIGVYAADVAGLVEPGTEVSIIGHSMGGVVAFALASGMFGLKVRAVTAFGVKTEWRDEDFERGSALAKATPRVFASRDEAIDRYLRVSGLIGLVEPSSEAVGVGVVETDGGFRLAADQRINDMGRIDFKGLVRLVRDPIHLLCGDQDRVGTPDGMASLGYPVTRLEGLGHYPQLQAPDVFWKAVAGGL